MHQLSRARIVASRDSMLEVLGTLRLIAISSATATSSDLDRRGALDSIADTTREAIEEYRTQTPEQDRPFLTIKRSSAVSSGHPVPKGRARDPVVSHRCVSLRDPVSLARADEGDSFT